MRNRVAALKLTALALSVLLALGCASSAGLRPLSERLPSGMPSAALRATWERIDGDYETGAEQVRYSLFVDPERPLLFRITHYRVSVRRPRGSPDAPPSWRNVNPSTPEFLASMRRVMEIYARVRREGRAGPPVG